MGWDDLRRQAPRVSLDGLCGVITRDELRPAAMLDLSAIGLRLERPFDPKTAQRVLQLEIELPGTDEVIWACAEVARAHLSPMGGHHPDGQPRLWCRAGVWIRGIARHEQRLMHDYVFEARRTALARVIS